MYVIKGDGALSFENARAFEKEGDLKTAASAYEKLLKGSGQKLKILQRLLIISRKQNETKKELSYIDAAIKIHERQLTIKKSPDKKLTALSGELNKMLGHVDKKGKTVFVPDELQKLEARRLKLLNKQKKK